ncbi:hypothetical protein LOZ12_003656 [Ophidiomyces ophidiicola]|uniref:Uncharacterized protein n=1 Tax=Ophidiomyces ophidiicola TaxID=1387563 RepID=A0ACB8UNP2_9EURO|nr:hypothetical protein LOZ59_006542 [Ophidiomyces ophidiicola]KAI1951495.1 hypothetical protein LOZ62_001739 [Ophidiomyces ophidiicola]KAI1972446.1 hypothetical protein LOZ56_002492 [Ophidiomyces ophidiicola]KAI2016918.1 hypothetical protein LOZ45_006456 [Ophidiomyces ophidiicola]KAI2039487.1 hypothetical protein LOZ47_002273 [Ophidiomyces ophidiicola]
MYGLLYENLPASKSIHEKTMASAIKAGVQLMFIRAQSSPAAIKRILNPSLEGAGTRVYPPQTAPLDKQIGVRLDKGERVHGKENVIKMKLQVNKNADNPTLKNMANKDPHAVVSEVEIDVTQDPTVENLRKVFDNLGDNIII